MSEPKACPCGGQVYVGELKFTGETQWCVGCLHCNRGSGKHAEKSAAIAAWNAYVVSVVGKAQRPEGSAQREARSEHIPTPEGRGGERDRLIKAVLDAQLPSNYQWGEDAMEAFNYGKTCAANALEAALLSSPRVEEVRREALEEAAKVCKDAAAHVRSTYPGDVDAAIGAAMADDLENLIRALSPPVG